MLWKMNIFGSKQVNELKDLFKLALPTMLTQLFRFLNPSISIVICGHLSREELNAASLANSMMNILGLSIDTGFSTACDTLFAQAYGSKYRNKMGIFLQRAILVVSTIYLLLLCLHLNIQPILLALGQESLTTSLTAEYMSYFIPGLYFDFLFLTVGRYLQAQNIVMPMVFASLFGTSINFITQYFLVYQMNLGLRASSICLSISYLCMLLFELAYMFTFRLHVNTWSGFNVIGAFSDWGIYFRLGIPGIFMVGLEEWCFEVMTLIAGTLGEVTLGAQAITFQIQSIIYMIPLGLFTALNIRVGQKLGAMDPNGARFTFVTALGVVSFVALCTGIPVVVLRKQLPYIFTTDVAVCDLTTTLLPMLLIFQFCEGFAGVSEAVLLACGRQTLGACIIFFGYYCIGLPFSILLTYHTSLGILGSLIGLALGFILTTIFYTSFAFRVNWTEEARQATTNVSESRRSSALNSPCTNSELEHSGMSSVELHLEFTELDRVVHKGKIKPLVIRRCKFLLPLFFALMVAIQLRSTYPNNYWTEYCYLFNGTNRPSFCTRMLPTAFDVYVMNRTSS